MDTAIDWTPKARAILAAASDLFYEHGIHAVGVDAIARRAGVTKKTLYDRFGSKDRLVVEYLSARDETWRCFLDEHLTRAGGSPRDRLAAVFTASAEWAAQHGQKGCAMINAHAEISDPGHAAYPTIIGQKQWMLGLFRSLAHDAGVAAPDVVAEELMLLHEGALAAGGMGVVDAAFDRAGSAALERLR